MLFFGIWGYGYWLVGFLMMVSLWLSMFTGVVLSKDLGFSLGIVVFVLCCGWYFRRYSCFLFIDSSFRIDGARGRVVGGVIFRKLLTELV